MHQSVPASRGRLRRARLEAEVLDVFGGILSARGRGNRGESWAFEIDEVKKSMITTEKTSQKPRRSGDGSLVFPRSKGEHAHPLYTFMRDYALLGNLTTTHALVYEVLQGSLSNGPFTRVKRLDC